MRCAKALPLKKCKSLDLIWQTLQQSSDLTWQQFIILCSNPEN